MKVALSLIVAVSASDTRTATPIQKILDTIAECQAKVTKEGEEAQAVYSEFAEWCEDRADNLRNEVKTAKAQSEGLQATIMQQTSNQMALTSKIEDFGAAIASDDAELAAATKIRGQENTDFLAEEKELTGAIDSLGRAITVIEREMATGGASMMQLKGVNSLTQVFQTMVQASAISTADAQKLTSFVQSSSDEDDELSAPAGAVYESHSGGIVDTLGGLHDQANEQLDKIRKAEQQSNFAYQKTKQSLDDAIRYASEDLAEAKKSLAASQEEQAAAQGDLEVTQKDLAEDQTTLGQLHQTCMARSQDFETQVTSRSEELKGLAAAKDAVSQIVLRGNLAFLQTSSSDVEPAKQIVQKLRNIAHQQKDAVLSQIASRMASTVTINSKAGMADVFAKIKAQIEDSIAKIQEEQAADATQTAYCDKQLAETTEKQEAKMARIEKHDTKINKKTSTSKRVKEEVAVLQKELATMVKEKLDMDNLRQKEKADYDFNKAEVTQSLKEIKFALKVLRDFYGTYMKEHEGFSSSEGTADGIIAMLETVESDFSKNLYEMNAVEEAAVTEYTAAVKTFETDKVVKDQAIKYKTREYISNDKGAAEETTDREGTQSELDAINDSLAQLHGMCTGKAETYDERVARRDAEIADLKESLDAIENEAAAEAEAAAAPAAEAAPAEAAPAVAEEAAAAPPAADAAAAPPAADAAAAPPAAEEAAAPAAPAAPEAAAPAAPEEAAAPPAAEEVAAPAAPETSFVQRSIKHFLGAMRKH